jgi:hypothetical protein
VENPTYGTTGTVNSLTVNVHSYLTVTGLLDNVGSLDRYALGFDAWHDSGTGCYTRNGVEHDNQRKHKQRQLVASRGFISRDGWLLSGYDVFGEEFPDGIQRAADRC